jgi:hypothetical protein
MWMSPRISPAWMLVFATPSKTFTVRASGIGRESADRVGVPVAPAGAIRSAAMADRSSARTAIATPLVI